MARHNLPRLSDSATFANTGESDRWVEAIGTLGELSASIHVDKSAFADENEPVRAIPDPWAQARMFGEAVLDERHSMHREMISQWRGLLAMCALSPMHAAEYRLEPLKANLDGATLFSRVLSHLIPHRAVGGQVDLWRAPLLIMMQRTGWPAVPVAMSNPICLISPGRTDLGERPPFAWAKDRFADPLKVEPAPPITEIAVLTDWLRSLERSLATYSDDVAAPLRERVRSYREECEARLGQTKFDVISNPSEHPHVPILFQPLFTETKIGSTGDPASHSQARLALSPVSGADVARDNADHPFRGIIIADQALADMDGIDPRSMIVWGTRTLAELLSSDRLYQQVKQDAAVHGWLLARAEDFFTRRCVRLSREGLIAAHPDGLQNMIAPLRPAALLLGERLPEYLSARGDSARTQISLMLPLEDGRFVRLSRHYAASPAQGEGELVGEADWQIHAASIWPDFRSRSYTHYVARLISSEEFAERSYVRPTSVHSRDLLLAEMADKQLPPDALSRLEELNNGAALSQAAGRIASDENIVGAEHELIWLSQMPFEAIGFHDRTGGRQEAYCGLVLLGLPMREPGPDQVRVAVDFGTTNTVACFDDREPIRFADRLVIPIVSANKGFTNARFHDRRFTYNKFFPRGERTLPTPSVAIQRKVHSSSAVPSVFRNYINFPANEAHAENGEAKELQQLSRDIDASHFNLKWSEKARDIDATTDYLAQLMWMIAAEAVGRGYDPRQLRWRFSVPDAMPRRRRQGFERKLTALTAQISTAVSDGDLDRPRLAPLVSEGLAAATHMLAGADDATQKLLTVIMDIGGGTTDIAIWDGSDVRWKGSFRLAGQDFFTLALNRNPQILSSIGLDFWGRMLAQSDGLLGVKPENLPHIAEMLFSGERLQQAIDANWDGRLSAENGEILRLSALTFLGGMAWYLGRVTARLIAEGKLTYGAQSRPAFALCGRGAGLFKKMHQGFLPHGESDVTHVLGLFSEAAGLKGSPLPQLLMQKEAKLEVVRGMLTDAPRMRAAAENWNKDTEEAGAIPSFTPAGLALQLPDGRVIEADWQLGAPQDVERVHHVDFAELDNFLAAMERHADIMFDLQPGAGQGSMARIEHAVQARLEDERNMPDIDQVEPPFIMALRQLVSEITAPEEQRRQRMRMGFKS